MGKQLREIKFRLWDKENFKMYHPHVDQHSWYFDDEYDSIQFPMEIDGFLSYKTEKDAILLQYTGLHDRNGTAIYEGDIIKREFEIGHDVFDEISLGFIDREIVDSGYWLGVVSYRPSAGFVLNKCRKFNDDELQSKRSGVKIHAQYAQVIGNYYENPELLEVK